MGDIGTAGKSQDPTQLSAACSTLDADVTSAEALPAIPDPATAQHFSAALVDYGNGASDCTAGNDQMDPSLLQRAISEFDQGGTEISAATIAIKSLG